jgi:hypothetical protein
VGVPSLEADVSVADVVFLTVFTLVAVYVLLALREDGS